jgi:hypothetical protein
LGLREWRAWTTTCKTTPNASYTSYPITIRLYDDAGKLFATRTQNFTIPYRPSTDPRCGVSDARWMASDGNCYNGYAFKITFDLSSLSVTLPETFTFEIAYNTADYGDHPMGYSGPIPFNVFNNLNVGDYTSSASTPSVGTEPNSGRLIWNGGSKALNRSLMAQVRVATR